MAVIIKAGIKQMYQQKEHCYYYINAYNENYPMPKMPSGCEQDILRGIYRYKKSTKKRRENSSLGQWINFDPSFKSSRAFGIFWL